MFSKPAVILKLLILKMYEKTGYKTYNADIIFQTFECENNFFNLFEATGYMHFVL